MTTRVRFFLQILYCNCLDSIVAGDICAWKFCPDICLNTAACLDREHIRERIVLHWRHHQPRAGAARRKTSWRVRTRNTFNRFTCRKAAASYPVFCMCMYGCASRDVMYCIFVVCWQACCQGDLLSTRWLLLQKQGARVRSLVVLDILSVTWITVERIWELH